MVFGDRRVIIVRGVAPKEPGATQIKIDFLAPFRGRHAFLSKSVDLAWQ
jgi:hypothetical protein